MFCQFYTCSYIVEGNECLGQWMPIRWIALPYTHPDVWTAFYHTPNLWLVDGGKTVMARRQVLHQSIPSP